MGFMNSHIDCDCCDHGQRYGNKLNFEDFSVSEVIERGLYFISRISYMDTSNENYGRLIVTTFNPKEQKHINPTPSYETGVIASFVNTQEGLRQAILFVEIVLIGLNKKYDMKF